ncbi:4a-hydroxytetrahydrobiopterin dehydratase [Gordonia humi]|uniref:Putative pterin-4-alpha-carbinolamine dehydratase n=1 Tax=Gordonia humi TaxID=686429 RepID=A0A840F3B4_9ACTN|nr:4a-hydroxytetrahydrobiopterin dehydratase [Gordonia humi]MBB4135909.1 4a-hydroxytetrahydrobiopterin dehydratase [Gordonia humi]
MDSTDTTADQNWTQTPDGLVADFATGTMVRGLDFVTRIVGVAEAANHHPDIDLRYPRVRLTLITHDAENTVTEKDHALARQISQIAADLGID